MSIEEKNEVNDKQTHRLIQDSLSIFRTLSIYAFFVVFEFMISSANAAIFGGLYTYDMCC